MTAYLNNWMKRRIKGAFYNVVVCHSNKNINVISMACVQWLNSADSSKTTVKLEANYNKSKKVFSKCFYSK